MEDPTQVLVVGAGPVGLLCAFVLATADIKVTIVDAAREPEIGTRAVVIHASTLDVSGGIWCPSILTPSFYHIQALNAIGMADDLVREGIPSTGVQLYDGSNQLLTISNDLLRNKTDYPFILFLPQHLTEHVLSRRLVDIGVKIHWQCKVVSMTPCDSGVQVGFENGSSITTQYVVGADGCRSTVRDYFSEDIEFLHNVECRFERC